MSCTFDELTSCTFDTAPLKFTRLLLQQHRFLLPTCKSVTFQFIRPRFANCTVRRRANELRVLTTRERERKKNTNFPSFCVAKVSTAAAASVTNGKHFNHCPTPSFITTRGKRSREREGPIRFGVYTLDISLLVIEKVTHSRRFLY